MASVLLVVGDGFDDAAFHEFDIISVMEDAVVGSVPDDAMRKVERHFDFCLLLFDCISGESIVVARRAPLSVGRDALAQDVRVNSSQYVSRDGPRKDSASFLTRPRDPSETVHPMQDSTHFVTISPSPLNDLLLSRAPISERPDDYVPNF